MNKYNNVPKKITNQDIEEMIEGIQENYLLREGLCGADLTECDMTELDYEHLKLLNFDEGTKFPGKYKTKAEKLLEDAKAPMKDIEYLHSKCGVDGSGVKVAIVDTNIDVSKAKQLYGNNFQYKNSEYSGKIEQHGATVLASFMQIAPNAELYYYPLDKQDKNMADHLLEYIKQIKESGIKIISLSNSLKDIMGEEKARRVQEYLKTNGITLIDSPTFYKDFTYCFRDIGDDGTESFKECLCEPEDLFHKNFWDKLIVIYNGYLKHYNASNIEELKKRLIEDENEKKLEGKKQEADRIKKVLDRMEECAQILLLYDKSSKEFSAGKDSPLHKLKQRHKENERRERNNNVEIPCGGRTLNGKYWGTSSASYTIPVIAGIFAMCKQRTNNQIEYDEFVELCKETSQIINGCNLIQPKRLIERVMEIYSQKNTFSKQVR